MHGLSIIIPKYKKKDNFENLIKKIYDMKIIFKSRTKNASKLGMKILLYIIQSIIIKFFASFFTSREGR